MICAWKELLAILPHWMRKDTDALGSGTLREIRLRTNAPPELVLAGSSLFLDRPVTCEDLQHTVNTASSYSPWAAATAARGYLTAKGGHRIGICGDVVCRNGIVTGMGTVTSLCIRVAGDYPGIAAGLEKLPGSVLILGAPGWGKTTLLRDLARQVSRRETVCVVDERRELFPPQFLPGKRMDVLTGCSKQTGIPRLLRTMGPQCIAVDEITEPEDVRALLLAANCGVRLLATVHGDSESDFLHRQVYQPLLESRVFDTLVILSSNNTYTTERMAK